MAPTITAEEIVEAVPLIAGARRYILQRFVVPPDKELIDPTWKGRVALSEAEFRPVWEAIKANFSDGGVR